MLNRLELGDFRSGPSRRRWVYGNYFAPELTTASNETWAINETMVPYQIGRHRVESLLPFHMLITPEDGARYGVHWDGLG